MQRSLLCLFLLALASCSARPVVPGEKEDRVDRMQWWREARLGLFIHWGLYAIPAGEWGPRNDYGEWIRHTARIPLEEYDRLAASFDPRGFDADEWVRLAKRAGARYIVITTKHHDGFCLFDSAHTDFDVMSTPFERDVMKELAAACRREGVRIGWYHSIMDWHHPDYLPRREWEEDRSADDASYERYVRYLHAQVEELLTRYGDVDIMWFDGEWEGTWMHEHGQELYSLCRRTQPDVIVNNRVDKGRSGMAGMTLDNRFLGDFGTPEQEVPAQGLPGMDWESCMTMNRNWGYNAADDHWKSSRELVRTLVDVASKGGNLLLNVGPTGEGRFPEPAIERLEEMGRWLDVNGESIYGTTASPFESLSWGRCTQRREDATTRLYLHVFDWPAEGALIIPGLGNEVVGAQFLATKRTLAARHHQTAVRVDVPAEPPDPDCTVIALDVVGSPIVYEPPSIHAPTDILVNELRITMETRSAGLDIRYTLDGTTPTRSSPRYEGPFLISDSATVKARTFHRNRAVSSTTEAAYEKVPPMPARAFEGLRPGIRVERYEGMCNQLPSFDDLSPLGVETFQEIGLPPGPAQEGHALRLRGVVRVSRADVYRFVLASDDGSRLWIDDELVVDNDGVHGFTSKEGATALAAGNHSIVVEYFNRTGGANLELRWQSGDSGLRPIDSSLLAHTPSDSR